MHDSVGFHTKAVILSLRTEIYATLSLRRLVNRTLIDPLQSQLMRPKLDDQILSSGNLKLEYWDTKLATWCWKLERKVHVEWWSGWVPWQTKVTCEQCLWSRGTWGSRISGLHNGSGTRKGKADMKSQRYQLTAQQGRSFIGFLFGPKHFFLIEVNCQDF